MKADRRISLRLARVAIDRPDVVVAPEREEREPVPVIGRDARADLVVPIVEARLRREETQQEARVAIPTGGEHLRVLSERRLDEGTAIEEARVRLAVNSWAGRRRPRFAVDDATGEPTEARRVSAGP